MSWASVARLDSARFAIALRNRGLTVNGATVLGEHGDHQVPVFSRSSPGTSGPVREEILHELQNASMPVMQGKGGTVFGPAVHVVNLLRAVAEDQRVVLPVSLALEGEYGIDSCSLAVPAEIGKGGARRIEEWKLDPWEQRKMTEAGQYERALCAGLPL